jgi:hemerythrin-like domain-containing protein
MIRIGARPDAGFDDPLRMLSDCHRRIERFLRVFLNVAREAASDGPLGADEREALAAALRYFAESAPLHTRDEDESLFPRLRRACAGEARVALERLDDDHRIAEDEHAAAEAIGRRWLAEGHLPAEARAALVALLESLQERYRAHILLEDTVVFPLAAGALDPDDLLRLGGEMRQRRGL